MASATLPKFSDLSPDELQYLAKLPALPPPPGTISNFSGPSSNGEPLVAVGSLLLALTVLFAGNRAYVKTRVNRKCSWDDCKNSYSILSLECVFNQSLVTLLIGFVRPAM